MCGLPRALLATIAAVTAAFVFAVAGSARTSASDARYTYHGCPVFTPNDWFTTHLVTGRSAYVSHAVDPASVDIINNIAQLGDVDFAGNVNPAEAIVNIATATNVIARPQIRGLAYGFANNRYNDDPPPAHIPITSGTFYQEGTYKNCDISGGDCHVNVLDTVKCIEYETYKSGTYGNGITGSWNGSTYWAEGGGVQNLNHPYQIGRMTVTSADIPMMGTTDWGEDLRYQKRSCRPNCAIPHILAFFLPVAGDGNGGYVDPAAAHQRDCFMHCAHPLPEGARLRLRAAYPCPGPSSYPQANLLCNQMKQYGIILNDFTGVGPHAGGVRLGLSSDATNPWKADDYNRLLRRLHITDFDVMRLGKIRK
jgi:hypothetical protein